MEFEAWKLITAALALGGSWGGAKVALNGTRERVKKLESRTDKQDERLLKQSETLARIETKQDILLKQTTRH